ncbi:MAG: GHKL domain-containing protein [Arcobacteraceae bacterium]|nr:GHKL domain-containing protein [Arcobacteraceae bacterium]
MKKLLLILFLVLSVVVTYGILLFNQNTIKEQLSHTTETYLRAYNTVYSEKHHLATTLSSGLIKMGKLKSRLSQLQTTPINQRNKIRKDMYNDLIFRYNKLKKVGIKQIQISLPNNISFLRMSDIRRYGDSLSNVRPSIVHINQYHKPVHTIEIGTKNYGLRFVYPIFKDDIHVGNIDLTFGTHTVTASIMKQYDVLSNLFVKLSAIQQQNIKGIKSTYKPSHHKDYYFDKLVLKELKKVSKKEMKNLVPQKNITKMIRVMGQKDKPSSVYDKNIDMIITIIPIINKITKEKIGFLSIRSLGKHTILSDNYIYTIIILFILFLAIGFYLLYILFTKKDELQGILDSQTNFIILTDGVHIKSVNKALLDFFNYKTLEDFENNHDCICDFFIEEDSYLQKEQDNKSWLDIILFEFSSLHQVKMKDIDDKIHIFQINTNSNNIINKDCVVTFTDITELEVKRQEAIEHKQDMLEKTKNAQMGEMIGNIAHQWRQPLSVISTLATGIIVQKECGILEDKQLLESCNNINEHAQFLSKTIDTFRDYIKEKKEVKTVILQDRLNSTIDIIQASLENHQVNLINNINNCEDITITMVLGELSQVVINIINNAKDIQIENKIEDKWIKIDLKYENQKAIIIIEDNGGGVPAKVMPKIFDPYYTTKHQTQGTGLGLHMSKDIIEKSLKGHLSVYNSQSGAVFTIELPLSY